MQRTDVLVIGGGPAGSSCARALAAAGLDVIVRDRSTFPRDKVCAGWITPQILSELEIDPAEYGRGRVLQPIRGFRLQRMGDAAVEIRYPEIVSYGILRREFDHYLLERSRAELRLGEPVRSLEREADGWVVDGQYAARLLVGAGGHFCPVARTLSGEMAESEPLVVAREIEFEMTPGQQQGCPVSPEIPELFFTPDLRGYGWIFRKGAFLNVGLGRQDPHAFPAHFEAFMSWLAERGLVPAGTPDQARGHAYLLYGPTPRPLVSDRVLLAGDAAGFAYPKSGEGIRPAIESGLLAARAIVEANGRWDASSLAPYREAIEARFGSRPIPRPGPLEWLPQQWREALVRRVLAWPPFARNVVIDRWFLHANQAPLGPGLAAIDERRHVP